jgi:hypothetical protein
MSDFNVYVNSEIGTAAVAPLPHVRGPWCSLHHRARGLDQGPTRTHPPSTGMQKVPALTLSHPQATHRRNILPRFREGKRKPMAVRNPCWPHLEARQPRANRSVCSREE